MSNLVPKSKVGQLVDLLRSHLQNGEWAGMLPPERSMAEQFLVSRSTLRKALQTLENEGCISGVKSSRSGRQITPGAGKKTGRTNEGSAVVLTPNILDNSLLLEHLAILRDLLGRAGIRVEVREATHLTEMRQPVAALAKMAAKSPDAVWILHKMPHSVQLAAQSLGLRCLVYGSTFEGIKIPFVDVDFAAVARHAAARCLAKGMKRIAVLVHRTPLAGDTAIVKEVAGQLAGAGAPPPLVLRHDFNKSRLIDALDQRIVPAGMTPDVLMVVSQHHLLTTLPHLLRRGLRIPGDISLIYLSNDPVTERLSPVPERYDLGMLLPRRLARSTQALLNGEMPAPSRLLPKLKPGETFASRAK
jgi:DNA-binding LacI/PurR family transcriptional regulator